LLDSLLQEVSGILIIDQTRKVAVVKSSILMET